MPNRQSLNNSFFPKYVVRSSPAKTKNPTVSRAAIIVGGLIFVSVLAHGGAALWTEAALLAIVFNLAAEFYLRTQPAPEPEIGRLLAPIFVLAAYSFVQGAATLLSSGGESKYLAVLLPESFDPAASFWCALKFFALGLFIRTLLANFRADLRVLIWSLAIIGNFFAVLGIVRFWLQASFPETFGSFILPDLRPGVGFGTFLNQNHFAFLMLMNLGLNTALCVHGDLEKNRRFAVLFFSILTWIAIILTASRGGIVSSFPVIVVSIFLPGALFFRKSSQTSRTDRPPAPSFSSGRIVAGTLALVTFAFVGVVLIGQERVLQRFEEIPAQLASAPEADAYSRPDVWQASAAMIRDHAFFGVGFGGFRYAVSRYIEISGEVVPQQAHNDYLELAASGGIVGVICGGWFVYVFCSVLKKRFAEPASRFERAARIGACGALAGVAVHSLFDFGLQFIGNWLFLAALLSVAVHRSETGEPREMSLAASAPTTFDFVKKRIARAVCLLVVSFLCLLHGFSRLENSLAAADPHNSGARNNILKLPFDAYFYETAAIIGAQTGDLEAAAENLVQAIRYRPRDYALWLKLGKTRRLLGQNAAAESAFRRAIESAPYYGEPFFEYGNFLVGNDRKTEGFKNLHFAFERNPRYFDEVFALALEKSNGDAREAVMLLMPLERSQKEKLADLLFARNEFAAIAAFHCREEDLSATKRGEMVVKLLEKREFRDASRIFARNCDSAENSAVDLSDGDFENARIEKNIGFGWRADDLPKSVKIGLDDETFFSGAESLGIVFDGASDPALPIVRQTVVVAKNQTYKLSFAYRTERILSGSLPVLQLIAKQKDNDLVLKEIKLAENSGAWIVQSATFAAGDRTEALEIRLARQNCGDLSCPIFGRMWLDAFLLEQSQK